MAQVDTIVSDMSAGIFCICCIGVSRRLAKKVVEWYCHVSDVLKTDLFLIWCPPTCLWILFLWQIGCKTVSALSAVNDHCKMVCCI